MKVLLVNPQIPRNFYNREFYLPSGVLYVAAALRENGDEPRVVDFKTMQAKQSDPSDETYGNELKRVVSEFQPELIGFGGLFSGNFKDILRFSEMTRREFPEVPRVVGGSHPSMYTESVLSHCPSIDWLVLGEGESTVVELVNQLKTGKMDFGKLDGFAYRNRGMGRINPKTKYVGDIDSIPFPAYDLINMEDYFVDTSQWHNPKGLKIGTEVPIISSRSCPNDCNFCASSKIMGRGWRARSPENVVDEIQYIVERYGQGHFSFMDDNLTLSKPRTLGICNEIMRRGLYIQFETHNGVSISTLDDEVIDAMAAAGLTRIALPIESGSDYIRNTVMGKRLSREKIFEVARSLRRHDQIYLRAFFIIGMPEETQETLQDTYRMIEELNVDRVHLTHIIPFPGTRVFEQAKREGLLRNIDLDRMYMADDLYQTNADVFFIKPRAMEMDELYQFRIKCEDLIAKQRHY